LKRVSLSEVLATKLKLQTEEELNDEKKADVPFEEKKELKTKADFTELMMLHGLSAKGKGGGGPARGLLKPNSTYRFAVSEVVTITADSGGVIATSTRIGDPTVWSSYSTFAAMFQRFRVVHVQLRAMRAPLNSNIGVFTDNSVLYMDTTATSVTPTSLAGVWASPGAKLYGVGGGGYGMQPAVIKPILNAKIIPEQEWFDLSTEKQRGCIAVYGVGNTHSLEAQYWYLRFTVELSGLLI
jgi:hypothetical protein